MEEYFDEEYEKIGRYLVKITKTIKRNDSYLCDITLFWNFSKVSPPNLQINPLFVWFPNAFLSDNEVSFAISFFFSFVSFWTIELFLSYWFTLLGIHVCVKKELRAEGNARYQCNNKLVHGHGGAIIIPASFTQDRRYSGSFGYLSDRTWIWAFRREPRNYFHAHDHLYKENLSCMCHMYEEIPKLVFDHFDPALRPAFLVHAFPRIQRKHVTTAWQRLCSLNDSLVLLVTSWCTVFSLGARFAEEHGSYYRKYRANSDLRCRRRRREDG